MSRQGSNPPTLTIKRQQWLDILDGDDHNAIVKQRIRMILNAVLYRVVNEAMEYAEPAPDGGVKFNWMIHHLLNHNFVESQVSAIRRIVDQSKQAKIKNKQGVCALIPLVKDIIEHRRKITRESMFEDEGTPYEYEEEMRESRERLLQIRQDGNDAHWEPCKAPYLLAERRHEAWDRLSGKSPESRSPNDLIQMQILRHLIYKLENSCKNILNYANQYVVHAGTIESRERFKEKELAISLNDIWEAHRHICQVSEFLSVSILGHASHSIVPMIQFNQFRYLEEPLIASSHIPALKEFWKELEQEMNSWSNWGMDDYENELKQIEEQVTNG